MYSAGDPFVRHFSKCESTHTLADRLRHDSPVQKVNFEKYRLQFLKYPN
jgi:hypothetical protein